MKEGWWSVLRAALTELGAASSDTSPSINTRHTASNAARTTSGAGRDISAAHHPTTPADPNPPPHPTPDDASQTAIGRASGRRGRGRSSCRSRSCAGAATSELPGAAPAIRAALLAVIQAYVCGVSTRRVDQLVESLGLRVSRSEMSRSCAPRRASTWRPSGRDRWRPLSVPSTSRSRSARRRPGGPKGAGDRAWRPRDRREILGLDVVEAESEALWTEFLRSRVARGLIGVSSPSATRTPG
jgi:hypothetical protein